MRRRAAFYTNSRQSAFYVGRLLFFLHRLPVPPFDAQIVFDLAGTSSYEYSVKS